LTREAFDVARLKRNWDRASSSPEVPLPERVAAIPRARDPFPEAERLLERIRALTRLEFSSHEERLRPFLADASQLLAELRARPESPSELRAQLLEVLADLEDLYEVYSGSG
jgi:CRISPR/Cas system Type II protein with McrA/HNH and RuvC-like nuclease domain